jgi:hypothetical protein
MNAKHASSTYRTGIGMRRIQLRFFLAAVAIPARRFGIYPSLLTAALATVAIDYFFNPSVARPVNKISLA